MATTVLQSYISLALDVTPKLGYIARDLASTQEPVARRFLNDVALELLLIKVWLENLSATSVSKTDLEKLLRNLERMCIYPTSLRTTNAPSQFCPTLKALQIIKTSLAKRSIYTALTKLSQDKSDTIVRHRKHLLVTLKSFAQRGEGDDHSKIPNTLDETKNTTKTERNDISYFVRALYKALNIHWQCHDSSPDQPIALEAKLRLYGLGDIETHSLSFELLFTSHPHIAYMWQDARVSVHRPRKVNFDVDKADTPPLPDKFLKASLYPVTNPQVEICQLVNVEDQVKLAFTLLEEQFKFEGTTSRDIHEWIMNHPGMNLATILAKGSLTHRMRLLLSITLAKAVWQFYDSDWMIRDWNKEHISFMYTCTNGSPCGQLYASKPFLSTRTDTPMEQVPSNGRIHRYPKILSLGLMLLEIELDITIESQRRPEHMRSDRLPNINTDYTTAQLLLANDRLWTDRETYGPHKTVITTCIEGTKFEACADIDEERDILYESVVSPLQELLDFAWPSFDEQSLAPMKNIEPVLPERNTVVSKTSPNLPVAPPVTQLNANSASQHHLLTSDHANGTATVIQRIIQDTESSDSSDRTTDLPRGATMALSVNKLGSAADEWFAKIDNISSLLRKQRRRRDYDRVRIAVLDTGIRGQHPHWNNISGWKDFVQEGNLQGIDHTGHGTNGVDLLWRILPEADVFVARIFESDTANSLTPMLMAKGRHQERASNLCRLPSKSCGQSDACLDCFRGSYPDNIPMGYRGIMCKPENTYQLFQHTQQNSHLIHERTPADSSNQAIRYATTIWKVDILSISAGFEETSLNEDEYREIRNAVLSANEANILVFAAASNYGNVGHVTYPASMHGNVMCMFSSTGLIKQSEDFNPAPSEASKLNFCMLGEEVQKVRFTPTESVKRTSGTSVATSIAAGIAALLIDFTRQEDCRAKIANREKLKTISGISAVFHEMARGGKDNNYLCVAPWKFLDTNFATMRTWDIAAKREYLCSRIRNILLIS